MFKPVGKLWTPTDHKIPIASQDTVLKYGIKLGEKSRSHRNHAKSPYVVNCLHVSTSKYKCACHYMPKTPHWYAANWIAPWLVTISTFG